MEISHKELAYLWACKQAIDDAPTFASIDALDDAKWSYAKCFEAIDPALLEEVYRAKSDLLLDCSSPEDGGREPATLTLYVNCSDLFAWGCADAELLSWDELPEYLEFQKRGESDLWCAIKRQMQPQPPVIKRLKEAGKWDERWEALPANPSAQRKAETAKVVSV